MITTRKELSFFLKADRMMNRGRWTFSIKDCVKMLFLPDYIMFFLSAMRHVDYYSHCRHGINNWLYYGWLWNYHRLSRKLGFSIGPKVFGYGLVIYHYGTIVVGDNNRVGNYAVLHTSTCIVGKNSIIGNALFMSTGAIISNHIELGDNVTVGANSVVCNSTYQNNVLLTGSPATVKQERQAWYNCNEELFHKRVELIESLKVSLAL